MHLKVADRDVLVKALFREAGYEVMLCDLENVWEESVESEDISGRSKVSRGKACIARSCTGVFFSAGAKPQRRGSHGNHSPQLGYALGSAAAWGRVLHQGRGRRRSRAGLEHEDIRASVPVGVQMQEGSGT